MKEWEQRIEQLKENEHKGSIEETQTTKQTQAAAIPAEHGVVKRLQLEPSQGTSHQEPSLPVISSYKSLDKTGKVEQLAFQKYRNSRFTLIKNRMGHTKWNHVVRSNRDFVTGLQDTIVKDWQDMPESEKDQYRKDIDLSQVEASLGKSVEGSPKTEPPANAFMLFTRERTAQEKDALGAKAWNKLIYQSASGYSLFQVKL